MSMCNERRKSEGLLARLASDAVLTQAYRWLCDARRHYHHNDDVWHVRSVAQQTVERCREQASRLYEQGAAASRIGTYLQHWARWVKAGLAGMRVEMVRESSVKGCIDLPILSVEGVQ